MCADLARTPSLTVGALWAGRRLRCGVVELLKLRRPDLAIVYVREQGSAIRKRGGRMVVMKESEILLEIPLRDTTSVAVFGNVQVTTQAM